MADRLPVEIEVWSDIVCPWCWIGKRRLERAFAARPDLDPRLRWRAFRLNPDMPSEGVDRREYLDRKFGGEAGVRRVYVPIEAAGEQEGLPFAFDRIAVMPSTLDSHRLMRWAADHPSGQDAVAEALFDSYFARGENIGDRGILAEVAERAGEDAAEAGAMLETDRYRGEVETEDLHARLIGVTGVPCFVIEQRLALPGAVDPAVFDRALSALDLGRSDAA